LHRLVCIGGTPFTDLAFAATIRATLAVVRSCRLDAAEKPD